MNNPFPGQITEFNYTVSPDPDIFQNHIIELQWELPPSMCLLCIVGGRNERHIDECNENILYCLVNTPTSTIGPPPIVTSKCCVCARWTY